MGSQWQIPMSKITKLLNDGKFCFSAKNLFDIAELADRYQISSLLATCKRLLKSCVERPLIERILFTDRLSFKDVQVPNFIAMGSRIRTKLKRASQKLSNDLKFLKLISVC